LAGWRPVLLVLVFVLVWRHGADGSRHGKGGDHEKGRGRERVERETGPFHGHDCVLRFGLHRPPANSAGRAEPTYSYCNDRTGARPLRRWPLVDSVCVIASISPSVTFGWGRGAELRHREIGFRWS